MIIIVLLGAKVIAAAQFKQENVDGEILPVSVLELIDTNTDTDINISEFFIRNGFAKTNVSDAIELENWITSSPGSTKLTTLVLTPVTKQGHVELVGKISKILSVLNLWNCNRFFVCFHVELPYRKIHVINIDDVLYLRGIEMAKMIPMVQQERDLVAELVRRHCTVNRSVINARTHPNVFMELAT